ncbi:MAG: hypothetical protein WKG01_14040 [Kofleriaceae bacterium]
MTQDEAGPHDNKDIVIDDSGSACAADEVPVVHEIPDEEKVASSCVAREDLETGPDLFYCWAGGWTWSFETYRGPNEYVCGRLGSWYCGTVNYIGWSNGYYRYYASPGTMCTN